MVLGVIGCFGRCFVPIFSMVSRFSVFMFVLVFVAGDFRPDFSGLDFSARYSVLREIRFVRIFSRFCVFLPV